MQNLPDRLQAIFAAWPECRFCIFAWMQFLHSRLNAKIAFWRACASMQILHVRERADFASWRMLAQLLFA
jgi:hypothetical protein